MPTHSELDWNVSPQPRKKAGGDINSPGYSPGRKKEEPARPNTSTGVESQTGTELQKEVKPEIRFASAKFEPHQVNGYEPNKKCVVTGTAEFLTKTVRTRCTLELFAVYGDKEEDLRLPEDKYGTAHIEKTGPSDSQPSRCTFIPNTRINRRSPNRSPTRAGCRPSDTKSRWSLR